jgi:DNA-directed RNA polymerase specialized sigma24 family protein
VLAANDLTTLYPLLRRRAYELTGGDQATTDDLTQETVLRILEADASPSEGPVKLLRYARSAMRSVWQSWGFEAP